ncbi:tetratricopeptide repeat protein [Candidatus Peribacteria bacterium]|nr:tetratricopeptide repeat protein [Candidatus Peribacteria bacterium]
MSQTGYHHPVLPRLPDTLGKYVLLLLIVPALTFAMGLRNDFVDWDDPALITENPISHGLTWDNVKASWTSYDPELYIPHTFLTYQVDYTIGGLHPFIYHLHNLLFHLLNVLLVAWLVFLLVGSAPIALVCGLLFAVHPLNAETVLWASARKDLLSSTWFFASIIAYLYARERRKTSLWIVSLLCFVSGLLSKVMIATLPVILLLIEWRGVTLSSSKGDTDRRSWFDGLTMTRLLPYVALSILFGIIALLGKKAFVAAASLQETILLAGKAVMFLLLKFVAPIRLSVLYPYTDPISFASPGLIVALLAVIVLTILAIIAARRGHRDVLFGWLWFLVCLSPTFLLYRRGEHFGDIYFTSGRYFYAAGVGLMLPLVTLAASRVTTQTLKGMAVAVLGVSAILSMMQAFVWKDTESLFRNVLTFYPNSQIAHVTIGNHYQSLGDLERAFTHYDKALTIRPTSLAYFNLGNALLTLNRADEAIEAGKQALELDPALVIAHVNLGVGYVKKEMIDEAVASFQKAIELDPNSVQGHFNLGVMFEKQKKWEVAVREYKRVLDLNPTLQVAVERLAAARKNLPGIPY